MTDIKFNNEYINDIKKKIINYVSRSNANANKITFNLSIYANFVVDETSKTTMSLIKPLITDGKVIPAKIIIGGGFFNVIKGEYYINPDYEDLLAFKLTYILVKGSASNIKYEGKKPVEIILDPFDDGYKDAMAKCIAEDINDYTLPDILDDYSFNKKVARMLNAIVGRRYSVNSFFRQDESFSMMIYSLSNKKLLEKEINKLMILINELINTLNNTDGIKPKTIIIKKLINNYKERLINLIICELYIPYINSVGLDSRKVVRDEIFKGFLGINYTNTKLNEKNKDSYYWASLINNTVPINNKISDASISLLKEQMEANYNKNLYEIYVKDKADKTKNNIKEFFVFDKKNQIVIINQNKKEIKKPELVEEILSYAYISSIDKKDRQKVEDGIIKLCEIGKRFKCSLKGNPLNNKMLVSGIIQLARKNGYELTMIGNTNNKAVEFDVKKNKKYS